MLNKPCGTGHWLLNLFANSVVYFVEICAVVLVYSSLLYEERIKRRVPRFLILFVSGIILGIVIQNIFGMYNGPG